MKITGLKINGIENPVGYALPHITISWRVEDSISKAQKSSTVVIALDEALTQVICERSGKLECDGVAMKVKLAPRTTYYVSVSVTGQKGDHASAHGRFETGKIGEPWTGQWIGMPECCSFHPILSKSFSVGKAVERACLYITGVGLYEAFINDEKVGDDFLAPFFNDYSCVLQVQTYDVTAQIAEKNTLSILLGNGWYKGRLGYKGKAGYYGKQFAAIAELHLEYADGTSEVIGTDNSWTACPSDITYSDIYDGEGVDRTLYAGNRPSYAVVSVDMSDRKLVDRYSMPLHPMEDLPVRKVIITPAGETVLDFGQNFSGLVSFHVKNFAPGTKITLEHGEVLQKGNFYHDNYRTAKTLITYISDGRDEWFAPNFTYMGFRYVKVTGWPVKINPADFVGRAVYSSMERTGWLETGNEKVNQLLSNALWGMKSNFLDMPTDCPQRDERLGWTGDAQVFAPTASFFMDTKAFYRKFTWDMRGDQKLRGGAIDHYLPYIEHMPGGASVWADAATFIPETVYETFGDVELLRENYPMMRDWVDYMTRGDIARGQKYLYDFAFTFGDWLAMDGVTDQSLKGGTEDTYISSVYYYASTCKVARAAAVLGYAGESDMYMALAQKIRRAILDEYFTPAGRLSVDTQTGYVIALRFGIWRDKAVLQKGLRSRLKRDGDRIRCGFVGAPLICETLADNGMMDLAMHLFLQEKFPSWLHCVNLGATTIWERWNSLLDDGSISGTGMNSLNHYAYGSVVDFVVRSIAGFRPVEAGYRRVRIEPVPDARLGKLDLTYISASGKYVADWKIQTDGKLALHYEIPFGCEAEVILPESKETKVLEAGSYDFLLETRRDYRILYTSDTLLDDVADDPKALEILKQELPAAFTMAMSGDIEKLSMSFSELAAQPWFGCPASQVAKALERLAEIRV